VQAGLFVPLAFRTEAPGVLVALDRMQGGEFSADDERLLSSFAVSAASAVVTARSLTLEQGQDDTRGGLLDRFGGQRFDR